MLIPSAFRLDMSAQSLAEADAAREIDKPAATVAIWTADAQALGRSPAGPVAAIVPAVASQSSDDSSATRRNLRPSDFEERQEARLWESLSARSIGSGVTLGLDAVKEMQIKAPSSIIEPSLHSITEDNEPHDDQTVKRPPRKHHDKTKN